MQMAKQNQVASASSFPQPSPLHPHLLITPFLLPHSATFSFHSSVLPWFSNQPSCLHPVTPSSLITSSLPPRSTVCLFLLSFWVLSALSQDEFSWDGNNGSTPSLLLPDEQTNLHTRHHLSPSAPSMLFFFNKMTRNLNLCLFVALISYWSWYWDVWWDDAGLADWLRGSQELDVRRRVNEQGEWVSDASVTSCASGENDSEWEQCQSQWNLPLASR